ncbi:hypothetical protein [Campylobacter showae]|nr:hypothetical protein [Campylobacter showae]
MARPLAKRQFAVKLCHKIVKIARTYTQTALGAFTSSAVRTLSLPM